jgi:regulator of RNase E activity RraA
MDDLADRLAACYSGAVYDVMREMGLRAAVLPRTIAGLTADTRVAGPVFTVRGRPDPTLDAHGSLWEWTGLLSKSPAGHVVVCQPQDDVRALMGELSAEALKLRGVRGYVVDGGCRDTELVTKLGFPVFCRFTSPIDIVAAWRPEAYDEPIVIGGVQIHGGDFILGDRDGVVVIPKAAAAEVIARTEDCVRTESDLRRAIRTGEDPQQAYLKYGKF